MPQGKNVYGVGGRIDSIVEMMLGATEQDATDTTDVRVENRLAGIGQLADQCKCRLEFFVERGRCFRPILTPPLIGGSDLCGGTTGDSNAQTSSRSLTAQFGE